MAVSFTSGPVQAKTTFKKNTDKGQSELVETVIEGKPQEQPVANVGYRLGHTKNLGNYESLRVEVSLHVPCPPDPDKINEAYTFAKTWVDNRMEEVIKELEEVQE